MTLRMDAFFVCIGILFILVSGCLAPVSPAPEPMMQITTVPTAAPETTTLSETHGAVFTRDEVGELFIDIEYVRKFTKEYNLLTPIEVFSEDPLSSTGSPIIVYPRESLESLDKRFIACQETDPGSGDPLFLVYTPVVKNPVGVEETTTRIYLNAALQGVGRDHYLQKAMLYYLGFPGQTYTYPESVFYLPLSIMRP
jgi:hypothetical protein